MTVPAADNLRLWNLDPKFAPLAALSEAADLLEAIDALHQAAEPILYGYTSLGDSWCEECGPDQPWPCPTARLLHPEVQP